jgi:hypothetical protein
MSIGPEPTDPTNLVLRQLQGLRREMAAVLENQRRDRELITRLTLSMDQISLRMDQGFAEIRKEISAIRSDLVMLENGLLNRQNEILDLVRRIDESTGGHDPEFAP